MNSNTEPCPETKPCVQNPMLPKMMAQPKCFTNRVPEIVFARRHGLFVSSSTGKNRKCIFVFFTHKRCATIGTFTYLSNNTFSKHKLAMIVVTMRAMCYFLKGGIVWQCFWIRRFGGQSVAIANVLRGLVFVSSNCGRVRCFSVCVCVFCFWWCN